MTQAEKMESSDQNSMAEMLVDDGLLQFGRFASSQGDEWEPYRLNLQLLPSYPDVLNRLIEMAAPRIEPVDHLVCGMSALPFGTGVSLRTGIPLVYSRETDDSPVYDLVGAYDIGHPALLLAYTTRDLYQNRALIERAGRVGLNMEKALLIVDEGFAAPQSLPAKALLHLPGAVSSLIATNRLPAGYEQMIHTWISSRHPD